MKAMILTAGLGTRLKPLTDKYPKPLIPVGGVTMLDISLAFLQKHGINQFIVNVHHLADQLMEFVAQKRWEGLQIEISDETGQLMDTGGGLQKAQWFFNSETDFVLTASDVLTDLNLSEMIKFHKETHALATLAVKERETSRNLLFDNSGQLAGWKNNQTGEIIQVPGKSTSKALGFSGIHVINAKLFNKLTESGAFSIVQAYLRLAATEKIMGFDHSNSKWMEFGRINNIEGAAKNTDFIELLSKLGF
ncbi:MAG: nucleotidyltransferase family protein [Bacteroidales bacterium]|nr:nucleotidyltransferase family protein [Bacteroidales bacterium]